MKIDINDLGQKLIDRRAELGITQVQLAAAARVSLRQLKRYEKEGYRSAPLEKLQRLVNVLWE
jgi:transcriptional regulator with XRE-family HTH domain